jgi:hypothetical protein
VKKNVLIDGYISRLSLSASSIARSLVPPAYAELNASVPICVRAASPSSLRPWPTFTFHRPESPSMYSRPVESLSSAPSPDTHTRVVAYADG